jgi:hypothetical protein
VYPEEFKDLALLITESEDAWSLEQVSAGAVVAGLQVSAFTDVMDSLSVENYLLTLSCIWLIFASDKPAQQDVNALLHKLQCIEAGEDVDIDDILDDRVSCMLQRMIHNNIVVQAGAACTGESSGDGGTDGEADGGDSMPDFSDMLKVKPDEFMKSIQNSKIATLAQEISQSINLGDDPKEMLSGGGIGNMIKSVSETISKKISDGSLNHQELLSEAMGVMKSLNTNKLFKNMNINMGALQQMSRANDTKTRLREKLNRGKTGVVGA